MYVISRVKNYRLSFTKKQEIAANLIASIVDDEKPTEDTELFINEWCVKGNRHKKGFIDVWNIVLNGFKPNDTPLLYRACGKSERICERKVASYAGSFKAAFNRKEDKIIVLDTKSELTRNSESEPATFAFFPLCKVMEKHNICTSMIPEEEYIVRESGCCSYIAKKEGRYR